MLRLAPKFALVSMTLGALGGCVHQSDQGQTGLAEPATLQLPGTKPLDGVATRVKFRAREFKIESVLPEPIGSCSLGATLLSPEAPAVPKALVVIVHGSGPMDRDGTITGGYRPYRDMAEHLAGAGYAAIRFDKRAAIAPCAKRLKEALRADHFLKDVVEVTQFAQKQLADDGLGEVPLVLLGHSEGVTYVAELTTRGWLKPKALVLLAGLGRYPMDATLLRQLRDKMQTPGLADETKKQIEALLKQGEEYFMRLREGEAKPGDFYIGAYSAFWLDMIQMTDAAALTASHIGAPTLLLQGSRDANVAPEDFEALRGALGQTTGSDAAMLDGLDHLFSSEDDVRVAPAALTKIESWLDGLDALRQPGERS